MNMGDQPSAARGAVKSATPVKLCQVCASDKLRLVLDLGPNPACVFLTEADIISGSEGQWPLEMWYCEACGLVQSGWVVDPTVLFGEGYHHISGIPDTFRKHLSDLASSLVRRFTLSSRDLVVDIGSSDGALLEQLVPYGPRILGVDPSSVARIAIANGLPTINEFFDQERAIRILEEYGRARVITALNTFAHVARLDSLMRGVKQLLDDLGVFVTESQHLLELITKLQYDFIYHEHLRYYSLKALMHLFDRYGMQVFDVEPVPTHGGSIRVYACKVGAYRMSDAVGAMLAAEERAGLASFATYRDFAKKVEAHRTELNALLSRIKGEGKRICGITYPARAITLLTYCGIGPEVLDYVTEKSPIKIGKYTPGTHIKIVDEARLFEDQPDYGLLLSWHLTEELVSKFRARGFRGMLIVPLPEPAVV